MSIKRPDTVQRNRLRTRHSIRIRDERIRDLEAELNVERSEVQRLTICHDADHERAEKAEAEVERLKVDIRHALRAIELTKGPKGGSSPLGSEVSERILRDALRMQPYRFPEGGGRDSGGSALFQKAPR